MQDPYKDFQDNAAATCRRPFSITPHDSVTLPLVPKGIYVGKGGDITLRGVDAKEDVTYRNMPDASYIAVQASHVRATGTTATFMIGEG